AWWVAVLSLLWAGEETRAQRAGCKNVHYDLVFLLDSSSSVGRENFQKVRQWVVKLVETFEVGVDGTHVGVVSYSDRPHTEFELGAHHSAEAVQRAANAIPYRRGNTRTGEAIGHVALDSFTVQAGGR
uniref:VWFA domain-containing protein n=2 Tax=Callorhinchus milii TaxID=7868 RepID=A0A4W3H993_CALMI